MVDKFPKSDLDFLDFHEDKTIRELTQGERVYFSEKLYKTNRFGFSQERNIMITNKGLYNLKKKTLKRKIEMDSIRGITVSKISDEFVVHGNREEYDYEYNTPKRKKLIEVLAKVYYEETKKELAICEIDKKSLKDFVTSKKEKKKDPDFTRMPDIASVSLHYFLFGEESDIVHLKRGTAKVVKVSEKDSIKIAKENLKSEGIEDFTKVKLVNENIHTRTYIVENNKSKEYYLMKQTSKFSLIEKDLIDTAVNEKKIMEQLDHQNLLKSICTYQDDGYIYTICPYVKGGDLMSELKKNKNFDEERVRFYAWQIIFVLEELHSYGYILKDIRPENILIDDEGYIKIFDFGLTKHLKGNDMDNSLIGTTEYLAPEQINGNSYEKSVDFWNLGILLYEMICGFTPFASDKEAKMYNLIRLSDVKFSKKLNVSFNLQNMISGLLEKNPKRRLGVRKGIEELKTHPFLNTLDSNVIKIRKYFASFCPDPSETNKLHYYQDVDLIDQKSSEVNAIHKSIIETNKDKFKIFSE